MRFATIAFAVATVTITQQGCKSTTTPAPTTSKADTKVVNTNNATAEKDTSKEAEEAAAKAEADKAKVDAEKAKADAEKAKSDAEKAKADAEKAIVDADEARVVEAEKNAKAAEVDLAKGKLIDPHAAADIDVVPVENRAVLIGDEKLTEEAAKAQAELARLQKRRENYARRPKNNLKKAAKKMKGLSAHEFEEKVENLLYHWIQRNEKDEMVEAAEAALEVITGVKTKIPEELEKRLAKKEAQLKEREGTLLEDMQFDGTQALLEELARVDSALETIKKVRAGRH